MIDPPADLNSQDDEGFVWTFLDEARDPPAIRPGRVVMAGTNLTTARCEVVDLIDDPAGTMVRLRPLPPDETSPTDRRGQ